MARLVAHNPPKGKLRSSGYMGEPTDSRELTENHKTYNVKEYAEAVTNIPDPVLIEKTVAKNGTYNASLDNVDGYDKVNVALPFDDQEVTPSTIQQTVTPREGYEALERVVVKPTPLDDLTVIPSTTQQTITPQASAIGFNKVIVEGYTPPPEVESKYVDFYDYDGKRLYSYTKAELNQLTELPPLPTREGLTCQEWNWSLADIKTNGTMLMVGATYTPSDGKTRMIAEIEEDDGAVEGKINFVCPNGAVITIDWGDGTVDTYTAPSSSTDYPTTHNYTQAGRYTIKIGLDRQIKKIVLPLSYFAHTIKTLNVGNYIQTIALYSFDKAINLKELTIPNTVEEINNISLRSAFLRTLIIPKGLISVSNGVVNMSYGLERCITPKDVTSLKIPGVIQSILQFNISNSVTDTGTYALNSKLVDTVDFPEGLTTIGQGCCYQAYSLQKVFFPKSLTSIAGNAFFQCDRMLYFDCSAFDDPTSIPTIESTSFSQIGTLAKFYFRNQTMLDAFASATNWSALASRFVVGGRYAT